MHLMKVIIKSLCGVFMCLPPLLLITDWSCEFFIYEETRWMTAACKRAIAHLHIVLYCHIFVCTLRCLVFVLHFFVFVLSVILFSRFSFVWIPQNWGVHLAKTVNGVPVYYVAWPQKLEWWGYLAEIKFDDRPIFSRFGTITNVLETNKRRTDRQTPADG